MSNKASVSFVVDKKTSLSHNNREHITGNDDIDLDRVKDNITYKREDIRDVYSREFDEAVEEYNSKQKRKNNIIDDYYTKMLHNKSTNHQMEIIVGVGKKDDGIDWDIKKDILNRYALEFEKENPNLKVYNSVMHLDEANPHLHINYVPVAEKNKNGLSKKVSNNKAFEQMGYGKGKFAFTEWQSSQREKIASMMEEYAIERVAVGTHKKMTVKEYKELQEEMSLMKDKLTAIKGKSAERTEELAVAKTDLKTARDEISKITSTLGKIEDVDKIEAKPSFTGSKVVLEKNDFNTLKKGAKANEIRKANLATASSKVDKLESAVARLREENGSALQMKMQIVKLEQENEDLKEHNNFLRNFIEQHGLKEKLESALNAVKTIFKKKSHDFER